MRYLWNLSASLLGAATTIALVQPVAVALIAPQIDQIAEAVTVRINTPGSSGSGVIIQREGNTYTVLTAQHVVSSIRGNEEAYVIPASNELQSYQIDNRSILALPNNVDLAIFRFQSNEIYQTAKLGNSDVANRGEDAYVSGYPLLSAALNKPLRQFTEGKITANASQPLDGGYGIVYSNKTLPGMSGGPVFNSLGEVIGIHGRGDTDETQATIDPGVVVKTGFNMAVPINTFRRWDTQTQTVAVRSEVNITPNRIETTEARADSLLIRANQQRDQGRFTEAIALYDQFLALEPNNSNAYLERGGAYVGIVTSSGQQYNNDNRRALADFNRAIDLNPNNASAYASRGYLNIIEGRVAEGFQDYDKAVSLEPNNAELYDSYGSAYRYLGEYRKAIEQFNQSLRLDPNLFKTYGNRGFTYHQLGEYRQAIADYDRAIQLNASISVLYTNRGVAYDSLGEYRRAIADFDRAIQINPSFAFAYNNRGFAKRNFGDTQGAIVDFNQAIQLNPNYSEAYMNRGVAKYDLGDVRGAIVDLNQAIELNPNYAEAYAGRGNAYVSLGDNQEAIVDFNQAIELNPNYAEAYAGRGAVKSVLGDNQGAIVDLNQAIELNPNFAEAYAGRGAAKTILGDCRVAIQDLDRALAINPNFEPARDLRTAVASILNTRQCRR